MSSSSPEDVFPLIEVVQSLQADGMSLTLEDRTILLTEPLRGDAGLAVMRVIGSAQAVGPVGVAGRSEMGVAVGVWRKPEFYVTRWTPGRRWTVGYRIPSGSRIQDYLRSEGRIPTRLEIGNWYGEVPDAAVEAMLEVGVLMDEPPFPIPPDPPRPVGPSPRVASGSSSRPASRPRTDSPRREPRERKPAPVKAPPKPVDKVCSSCGLRKPLSQFVAGGDICVDCR